MWALVPALLHKPSEHQEGVFKSMSNSFELQPFEGQILQPGEHRHAYGRKYIPRGKRRQEWNHIKLESSRCSHFL